MPSRFPVTNRTSTTYYLISTWKAHVLSTMYERLMCCHA